MKKNIVLSAIFLLLPLTQNHAQAESIDQPESSEYEVIVTEYECGQEEELTIMQHIEHIIGHLLESIQNSDSLAAIGYHVQHMLESISYLVDLHSSKTPDAARGSMILDERTKAHVITTLTNKIMVHKRAENTNNMINTHSTQKNNEQPLSMGEESQIVLQSFAQIVESFTSIVKDPENQVTLGRNISQIASNLFNIALLATNGSISFDERELSTAIAHATS
jgi:hypothetical protein